MSQTVSQQERKEDCRRAVRRYLAERSGLAFRAATMRQKLNQEGDYTLEEIVDALVFLVGLKQVEIAPDELGATEFYQITSAGTLAHERGR